MKIVSWNVNGLRAVFRKDFKEQVKQLDADILFLQEVKMQKDQLTNEMLLEELGYKLEMHSGERKGYSGVAVYTRITPDFLSLGTGLEDYDKEGRVIRFDYKNFSIFGIYFPNGGRGEERMKYKMSFYEHYLELFESLKNEGRNVIVCGDFNVAHMPIDLANPKQNENKSGFLPIERDWFSKFLSKGFVDIWREQNPEVVKYSWWDARFKSRDRNVGWRIDYFVIDEKTVPLVEKTEILNEYLGSDHCPISLYVKEV